MGVKTPVTLSRGQAEERFIQHYLAQERIKYESFVKRFPNGPLETWLENANDEKHGGEGFENYIITDAARE